MISALITKEFQEFKDFLHIQQLQSDENFKKDDFLVVKLAYPSITEDRVSETLLPIGRWANPNNYQGNIITMNSSFFCPKILIKYQGASESIRMHYST